MSIMKYTVKKNDLYIILNTKNNRVDLWTTNQIFVMSKIRSITPLSPDKISIFNLKSARYIKSHEKLLLPKFKSTLNLRINKYENK